MYTLVLTFFFTQVIIHAVFTHSINQNNYYDYVPSESMYCRNCMTDHTQKNIHTIQTISDFTKCYYIVMISHVSSKPNCYWTQAVCNQSFFTLPEYPAGYCILLVSFFFFFLLLATLPRLIASTCPDRFPPNLVTRTPDSWHLCHLTRMGSKVT